MGLKSGKREWFNLFFPPYLDLFWARLQVLIAEEATKSFVPLPKSCYYPDAKMEHKIIGKFGLQNLTNEFSS